MQFELYIYPNTRVKKILTASDSRPQLTLNTSTLPGLEPKQDLCQNVLN